MKKQLFLLIGLLVSPAVAEVAPVFYDDDLPVEYADIDELISAEIEPQTGTVPLKILQQPSANVSRGVSARGTASHTAPTTTSTASGRASSGASGRVVAARNSADTSSRATSGTAARSAANRSGATSRTTVSSRTTSARTATTGATRTATASRSVIPNTSTRASGARTATSRAPTTSNGARASRAAIKTVGTFSNTATDTLYNPNSRIGIRTSASSSRVPTIRVATASSLSAADMSASTASTLAEMDNLAEMTDYCKSQYASCMDNYCNVLDDNQGRCSCSSNIKSYAKAESALKAATEELQEVAQKIQYIGLTSREVETLFNETEAELAMQTNTDTSAIKTSLDKIKDMLIEVRTGTASSDASNLSGFGFDMNGLLDFTIDSTGFDISSFLGTFGTNTNSVTNQRGEELYKTAVNRCKSAVLKSCTNQGVDANLITNSYDLQIDKECILYERSLSDANDQMVSTIRNAKSVLQKARLLVSQQKNVYDMRGCINALDSCMQDEFVCGTDYENCLDPTGRYIVNGAIVLGSQPGHAIDPTGTTTSSVMTSDVCAVNLYRTWDMPGAQCSEGVGNAWNSNETLANYIEQTVTATAAKKNSTNLSEYLQNKIGYNDGDRNYGMCMSVLNKCQDYTYGKDKKYNPTNDVIKQYLSRVLIQIKAKQDQILSDYADSCVADVTSCLSQNNYPSTASAVSSNSMSANIAINACRPTIVTCMSVNGFSTKSPSPSEIAQWVCGIEFPNSNECGNVTTPDTKSYSITWNVNGGSVSNCPAVYTPSSTISCNPKVPNNAHFVGWCRDSSLTNCSNGSELTFNATDAGDTQRYAKWECDSEYRQSGNACVAQTPEQPTANTCSSANLSACNESSCNNLGDDYKWCSTANDTTPSCRSASYCPNYVKVTVYNQ